MKTARLSIDILVAVGAMVAGLAYAQCIGIDQPACPEQPPGHNDCVNANAPSDNYEVKKDVSVGYLTATPSGHLCFYDCPGDNPNHPTEYGDKFTTSGVCPPHK
jgi:hypothetical protein